MVPDTVAPDTVPVIWPLADHAVVLLLKMRSILVDKADPVRIPVIPPAVIPEFSDELSVMPIALPI